MASAHPAMVVCDVPGDAARRPPTPRRPTWPAASADVWVTTMTAGTRRRPERLVFLGNYGNRNVGDDAILQVLSDRYAHAYPDHDQLAFARECPEDIRRSSRAEPLATSIRSALWAVRAADVLVVGGGGLFGAKMGPAARFIPLFALVCRLTGTTVIYESVGFYAATPRIQRALLFLSMLTAKRVTVRDTASLRMTARLARFRRVELVTDPGYDVRPVDRAEAQRLLAAEGVELAADRRVIGVSAKRIIADPGRSQRLCSLLAEASRRLAEQGHSVLFIPFCHDPNQWSEQDAAFADEIVDRAGRAPHLIVLRAVYSPAEASGLLSRCDAVLAMRLHAQIFAHGLGRPLLPIAYEEKRLAFVREHGYPQLRLDDLTADDLVERLTALAGTPSVDPVAHREPAAHG